MVTAGCKAVAVLLSNERSSTTLMVVLEEELYELLLQLLEKSKPVFCSRPLLSRTFSLALNQMHVVVFSESVFHRSIVST